MDSLHGVDLAPIGGDEPELLDASALQPLPIEDARARADEPKTDDPEKRLGARLLRARMVKQEQLNAALVHQGIHGGRLGSVLVALGFLSDHQLESQLGQQLGITTREVDSIDPPARVLTMIPEQTIRRLQVIPMRFKTRTLVVGMVDPFNRRNIDEIIFTCGGRDIQVELITEATFQRFIATRFANEVFREDAGLRGLEIAIPRYDGVEGIDEASWEAVHVVDFVLENAARRRASDVHVEPYEFFVRIRYRVDGTLYTVLTPPQRMHSALISRLKIMADMDIAERRRPQDGQIRIEVEGEPVDFRVSTLPTSYGEKCVVRLLKKEAHLADLGQLGFSAEQLKTLRTVSKLPQGLVLVTGPTGSGKTTTLHAVINHINDPSLNITTIEDPVESTIAGVNHVPIKEKTGFGFAEALRSILRQDPDVVFVGEMRDREVSAIALKAALTGHLVLSTLHTNGIVETFVRLIDMGLDTYLLASSIELVLAQRLLRRVCPGCAKPAALPPEALAAGLFTAEQAAASAYREGAGCDQCLGTGYKGRVAVYESLRPTPELRRVLRKQGDEQAIRDVTRSMGSMFRAAGARALAGQTTFAEIRRVLGEQRADG